MLRLVLRVVHHRWSFTGLVGSLFIDSMGGGAWPLEALSLLNSVQHDSYLNTSYKDIV